MDFLSNLVDPEYKESLEDKCLPQSTNDDDTKHIIQQVLNLINEVIDEFEIEITKEWKYWIIITCLEHNYLPKRHHEAKNASPILYAARLVYRNEAAPVLWQTQNVMIIITLK